MFKVPQRFEVLGYLVLTVAVVWHAANTILREWGPVIGEERMPFLFAMATLLVLLALMSAVLQPPRSALLLSAVAFPIHQGFEAYTVRKSLEAGDSTIYMAWDILATVAAVALLISLYRWSFVTGAKRQS